MSGMREIKIVIKKGGATRINDKAVDVTSAKFTKELADEMGTIKERHLDESHEYNGTTQQQQVQIGQG